MHTTHNMTLRPKKNPTLASSNPSQERSPYTALPCNTIRLFSLSSDTPGLHGELEVHSLGECPPYTAISYTWGQNDTWSGVLKINEDQTLKISETVEDLLLSLRKGLGATTPFLWIDQICINQAEEGEKQHQIGHMHQVYSAAEEVLVWLRKKQDIEENSALTIETIQLLQPSSSKSSVSDKSLSALLSLWQNPWFERLWVRQEVILAQKTVFWYGGRRIPTKKLAKACEVHSEIAASMLWTRPNVACRTLDRGPDVKGETAHAFYKLTRAQELFLLTEKKAPQNAYLRLPFLDVLRLSHDLKHANDHDLVYAIYHLTSAASNQNFWPNYRGKTLVQLWHEVAAYILNDHAFWNANKEKSGLICPAVILALAAAQKAPKSTGSASWVPELKKLSSSHSTMKFDHYLFYSSLRKAGGSKEFRPMIDISGREPLKLEGAILSQIASIKADTQQRPIAREAPLEFESDAYWKFITEKLVPWYLMCYQFVQEHSSDTTNSGNQAYRVNTEHNLTKFGVLLNQGVTTHEDLKVSPTGKQEKTQKHRTGKMPIQAPNLEIFNNLVSEAISAANSTIDLSQLYNDLLPQIVNDAWYIECRDGTWILAMLSNGLAGWVPKNARVGDDVVLIKGAPFPFVVRQDQGDKLYEMIGDAYVNGVMEGEAWEEDSVYALRVCTFEFK